MDSVRREGLSLFLVSLRGVFPRMLLVTSSTLYFYLWRWNMLPGKRTANTGAHFPVIIYQRFWAWGMGYHSSHFPGTVGCSDLYKCVYFTDSCWRLMCCLQVSLNNTDILTRWIWVGGGLGFGNSLRHCRIFSHILGLYPVDTHNIPRVMLAQNISRYCNLH